MIQLHSIDVRVYYEDTDAGGIVYYANYLRFFERARSDWLRAQGVDHQRLAAQDGLALAVRRCAIEYHRPARLDDLLAEQDTIGSPPRVTRLLEADALAAGVDPGEIDEQAWGHFVYFDDPDGNHWSVQYMPYRQN